MNKFLIVLLILLAVFTRFYGLGEHPKGFHNDEVSFAINTQSILDTLHDEDGQFLPLRLNSYIDQKPALYSYLQIPFFQFFGLSVWSSRIPAVILGLISIWLVYLILKLILPISTTWIAVGILILSPWHIMNTRATQEVIMSFVFQLAAIYFFIKIIYQIGKYQGVNYIFLFLSSLLAMYSYHSAKVFLLVFFVSVLFIKFIREKTQLKNSFRILFLTFLALGLSFFPLQSQLTRFNAVGIFSDKGPQLVLEEQSRMATGHTPYILNRIFYNKAIAYGNSIFNNYLKHFDPNFLFVRGGEPERYRIPLQGLFYQIEFLLIPLGLFYLGKKKQYWEKGWILLPWLFTAPLSAALTFQEIPSTIRVFPLIVPMIVGISIALETLWQQKSALFNFVIKPCLLFGYIWGISYFFQQFLVQQIEYYPWVRNVAHEKLADILKQNYHKYDTFIITNRTGPIYDYLLINQLISLPDIQKSFPQRLEKDFNIDKFRFIDDDCPFNIKDEKSILVVQSECKPPKGFKILGEAKYDDNRSLLTLYFYDATADEN